MTRCDALRRLPHAAFAFALAASAAGAHDASLSGPDTVGRGLQDRYALVLSEPAPEGGLVFQLDSVTPSACVLSASETSAGGAGLPVPVPEHRRRARFWVQAVGGGAGDCEIAMTPPPGWTIPSAPYQVALEPARLDLRRLESAQGALEPPSPFRVVVGVERRNGNGLRYTQRLSAGSCSVRACSGAPSLLTIVDEHGNDALADGCEEAPIDAPSDGTDFGALQAVAGPGVTQPASVPVTATSPGCAFLSPDTREVTVAPETVKVAGTRIGVGRLLGAGHQDDYRVHLSRPSSTPTTVAVDVRPGSETLCAVSASGTAAGGTSASVLVEAGRSDAAVYVQGLAEGHCELSASAPGYAAANGWIEVVKPGLAIRELARGFGAGEPDDPFLVVLGAATPGERVPHPQAVTPGSPAVQLGVCSSNLAAGAIVAGGAPSACAPVQVPALGDRTGDEPETDPNAVAFRPASPASSEATTVSAESLDPDAYVPAERIVEVSPIGVELRGPNELGSGLHAALQDAYVLETSRPLSQSTVIQLAATPACRLWNGSLAVATHQVVVAAGRSRAPVTLLAEPGTEDACTVSWAIVSGQALPAGARDVEVAPGALRIASLATRLSLYGSGDAFVVQARSPGGERQAVRPDQTLADVEVCSSDPDVVEIALDGGTPQACVVTQIDAGKNQTLRGSLVAVPAGPGLATITAQAPGFAPASVPIEVRAGLLELTGPSLLGRDLQAEYGLSLDPRNELGDVTVTLTALPVGPAATPVCALSDGATALGDDTLVVTIPAGERSRSFLVQGLLETEQDEPCTVVAQAAGGSYGDAEKEIDVVTPGLRLRDLATSTYVGADPDPFRVEVGVPTDSGGNLKLVQRVRPPAPLAVLACSLAPAVGVVESAASSAEPDCREAEIAVNASSTPDPVAFPAQAFAFRAVTQGIAPVQARVPLGSPAFVTTGRGQLDVNVTQLALSIDEAGNVDRVGSGLMDTFRVMLSQAIALPLSVTLRSDTPDVCRVAVNETTPAAGAPSYAIALTIPKGSRQANFQLHGLEALPDEDEGHSCELTATASGIGDATASIPIVPAAAKLANLDNSLRWNAGDERFQVVVGVEKTRSDGTTTLEWAQKVRYRAGSPGLRVDVCSSAFEVAALLTDALTVPAACHSVLVETGQNSSRLSAGSLEARLKLRPKMPGETMIEVQPGSDPEVDLVPTDAGREKVTLAGEGLTLHVDSPAVGAGLQSSLFRVEATRAPVSVVLSTPTPERCLVSLTGAAAGSDSLPFSVSNNLSGTKGERVFFVQGLSEGECVLEVAAVPGESGYGGVTSSSVLVRPPSLQIANLIGGYAVGAANDPFDVQLGVSSDLVALAELQAVRPGGSVTVSLTSSNAAVATLQTTSPPASGAALSLTIGPGAYSTLGSGLALVPGSAGSGLLSAQAPGFHPIQRSEAPVSVLAGCGLGFELAPVLLGLLALRRRHRRPVRGDAA